MEKGNGLVLAVNAAIFSKNDEIAADPRTGARAVTRRIVTRSRSRFIPIEKQNSDVVTILG